MEKDLGKNHTNSLETTDNNANSYLTESHQQEQTSGYNDGAMSLKNEDKNTALMPDPMKRFDNITDNRILRKRNGEILEELENNANATLTGCEHKYNTDNSRMKGYFCSNTIFNISNKVLTEDEIKGLEKVLDFAPIQRKVSEPELRQDFVNF